MQMGDGSEVKFQPSKWKEKMKEELFRNRVYDLMEEEVIQKFDQRTGKAEDFYESDA
jgi:hypothetical protein